MHSLTVEGGRLGRPIAIVSLPSVGLYQQSIKVYYKRCLLRHLPLGANNVVYKTLRPTVTLHTTVTQLLLATSFPLQSIAGRTRDVNTDVQRGINNKRRLYLLRFLTSSLDANIESSAVCGCNCLLLSLNYLVTGR